MDLSLLLDRAQSSQAEAGATLAGLCETVSPASDLDQVFVVLALLSRLARAPWLDGPLAIELTADQDETRVRVACDLGGGLAERALPTMQLRVPLHVIAQALETRPGLAGGLYVVAGSARIRLLEEEPRISGVPAAYDELDELDELDAAWDAIG